jgi:hypothetical protein
MTSFERAQARRLKRVVALEKSLADVAAKHPFSLEQLVKECVHYRLDLQFKEQLPNVMDAFCTLARIYSVSVEIIIQQINYGEEL